MTPYKDTVIILIDYEYIESCMILHKIHKMFMVK